jgi:hypothetical protein
MGIVSRLGKFLPSLFAQPIYALILSDNRTRPRRAKIDANAPLRKWSALKASAINLRIISVIPLDDGTLPTSY